MNIYSKQILSERFDYLGMQIGTTASNCAQHPEQLKALGTVFN
ncbi:MAG: hypothetical protein ACJA1I_001717 [Zhongshania marina]